jgi:hypothetical protein
MTTRHPEIGVQKVAGNTEAFAAARAEVGPLYRTASRQYTFRAYDADRDAWREGSSQPYAAARRSRADAIAMRVLTGQGVAYDDAYRAVYA